MAYEQKAMWVEAIAELQRGLELSGEVTEDMAALGHAYGLAGKKAEAQDILQRLKEISKRRYVSSFDIGLVHAGLGENDAAFEWLEKAYEERAYWLVLLNADPRLDSLRPDSRFRDLLGRVGLPP